MKMPNTTVGRRVLLAVIIVSIAGLVAVIRLTLGPAPMVSYDLGKESLRKCIEARMQAENQAPADEEAKDKPITIDVDTLKQSFRCDDVEKENPEASKHIRISPEPKWPLHPFEEAPTK